MNDIKSFIDKYNLSIRSYKELKNIKIIDTDKGKYVLKNKSDKETGLYEYLNNKNFDYLLEREEVNDYEVYPFVDEISIPKEEKALDLIYILSILHNKTTFYREVVLDKVKEQYESLNEKITYLNYYYHDLQDMIEQKVYMSPAEYLLIRNISLVYSSLDFSKRKLDEWYEYKIKQKKERAVLLHNKPSLDHILIGKDKRLISWDNYTRDIPIYDFIYFYKSDYMNVEMSTLFNIYQSRFTYTVDEYLLFLATITIVYKVEFTKNNYLNCRNVYKLVKYMEKTREFVLKENEKEQKEDQEKFQKQ